MNLHRSLSPSKRSLLIALLLPAALAAATMGCTLGPGEPGATVGSQALAKEANPVPPSPTTPTLRQRFDGAVLTDSRARSIVEAAGYEYISFLGCAPSSDDCAIFNVREHGNNGRPLAFTVRAASDTCTMLPSGTAAIHSAGVGSRASARTSSETVPSSTGTDHGAAYESADPCFYRYPVAMRAIYDGSTTFMAGYASTRMAITYQVIEAGKWDSRYKIVTGTVEQPWNSGLRQTYYYELWDGDENLLGSDTQGVDLLASSGASEPIAERCVRVGVGIGKLAEQGQAAFNAFCSIALPAGSADTGVGLSVDIDPCGTHAAISDALKGSVVEAVAAACQIAPGCFLRDAGTCDVEDPAFEALMPIFAEWAESGATGTFGTGGGLSCPTTKTFAKTVGDEGCIETTTEECQEIRGKCYCEVTGAVLICGGDRRD
jgi:hypothetical protein